MLFSELYLIFAFLNGFYNITNSFDIFRHYKQFKTYLNWFESLFQNANKIGILLFNLMNLYDINIISYENAISIY